MTQPRHSGTPVSLACSPHPPTALFAASLSSPAALGALGEPGQGGSAWARRLFHPARCKPGHGQLRARPGQNRPRDPEGFGGLCAAQQPRQAPAPAPSLLRNSQGRVPGRSPGKRPPAPGGHLRSGSSPSSAFPGGFRLSLFLRLPGARTFVPARPRLGVPPPPALTEGAGRREGGSAARKHRGQGTGPRPSASSPHTSDVHFQLKLDTNFLPG